MRSIRTIVPVALVVAAGATAGPAAAAPAAPSSALVREYEGTVVSVNRSARTFRLRDSERGTVRIRVTNNTTFERINGFAGLKKGMKRVEATVRRSNGRWVGIEIQRSGGGGRHGDDDD